MAALLTTFAAQGLADGDDNLVFIDQDDLTVSVVSGDSNDVGIAQWGTNTAFPDMSGASNDNAVSLFQHGTNDIHIIVEGSRNTVLASQDYDMGDGGDNEADIDVLGSDNAVDLTQRGTNVATITQAGDAHIAELRQVGSGNIATISQ